jgi:O-antigen biosynthesis protein WbqP
MKRMFDFVLAKIASFVLVVPIIIVALWVKLTSKGPALYWSDRVGINNTIFKMPIKKNIRGQALIKYF